MRGMKQAGAPASMNDRPREGAGPVAIKGAFGGKKGRACI